MGLGGKWKCDGGKKNIHSAGFTTWGIISKANITLISQLSTLFIISFKTILILRSFRHWNVSCSLSSQLFANKKKGKKKKGLRYQSDNIEICAFSRIHKFYHFHHTEFTHSHWNWENGDRVDEKDFRLKCCVVLCWLGFGLFKMMVSICFAVCHFEYVFICNYNYKQSDYNALIPDICQFAVCICVDMW